MDVRAQMAINVILKLVLLAFVFKLAIHQDVIAKTLMIVHLAFVQTINVFQIVEELRIQMQTAIVIYLLTVLLLLVAQILANQLVEEYHC